MNIVEIASGNWVAKINLNCGGNCICLKNKKYNLSVLREPNQVEKPDNPYLYGMPILFPPNRIQDGRFVFEGREYIFPINERKTNCHLHGFLHQAEFEISEQGASFIRCQYESDELYRFFPHKFRVEILYSLSEQGLLQEVTIHNLSATNMPVSLGFHSTFNLPFAQDSSADDILLLAQVGDEMERDPSRHLPTGNTLPIDEISAALNSGKFHPSKNQISRHYQSAGEGRIELRDTQNNIKIIYSNDTQYKWRLLFNGGNRNFICLEPQTSMVNCQNSDLEHAYTGFDHIAPYTCKKYISRIDVQFL